MIDKLEVPVKSGTPWTREIDAVRDELRRENPAITFSRSKDYAAVIDLREITGRDAMLHFQSRYRKDHKIELLNTGDKGWEEMLDTIASIVEVHPLQLECRRVDLCANVPEVKVDWFARSVRAQWKQWQSQIGQIEFQDGDGRTMEFSEMGRRYLQTMYLGKRPNCIRVYDKTAETYSRYQKMLRRHARELREKYFSEVAEKDCTEVPAEVMARLQTDFPPPSFEEFSGGLSRADVLTRVERQMAGGRVPAKIDHVYKLYQEARDFNPFERMRGFITSGAGCEVAADDFSPVEWLAGVQMMELLRSGDWTRHQLYQFLNRDRNAAKYERKFRPFIEAASVDAGISAADLYEKYRESVTRQLAA